MLQSSYMRGEKMNNIANASIFTTNKNLANEIKDRCYKFGLNISYISRLSDFLSHVICANNEIIFVDHKFNKIKDALSDFCKRYDNNIKIVYLSREHETFSFDAGLNIYRADVSDLDTVLPELIGAVDSFCHLSSNIPTDELFKYVSSLVSDFRILPKFMGYNYIIQAVVYAVKHCNNKVRLSEDIYKYLSEQNGTVICNIEKNIRTAIANAMRDNPHLFAEIVSTNKRITNATFINHLIARTRIECMERCNHN